MKKQNNAVTVQGATTANDLTQLAQLMTAFAKANPAIMAEITKVSQPAKAKTEGKTGRKLPENQAVFQGINLTGAYTSKFGGKNTFVVYGEGTRKIKDVLGNAGGKFNARLSLSRAGLTVPGKEVFPGFVFRLSELDKVKKLLK